MTDDPMANDSAAHIALESAVHQITSAMRKSVRLTTAEREMLNQAITCINFVTMRRESPAVLLFARKDDAPRHGFDAAGDNVAAAILRSANEMIGG